MKRRSHDPLSDLLSGDRSAGPDRDEVAEVLVSAKRTLRLDPDPATALAHLADIRTAVAEEKMRQRSQVSGSLTSWRTVSAGAAAVIAGTVAMFGGTIGLAYAGVNLPGTAAEKAVERVLGLELPNQATEDHGKPDGKGSDNNVTNGKSSSDAVHEVKESTEAHGCEFGQAVAAAARANSQNENAGRELPCKEKETGADKDKPAKDHGKPDKDKSNAGKADEDHGKADEDHGKSDEAPGRTDTPATESDKERGKSGDDHGKPDEVGRPIRASKTPSRLRTPPRTPSRLRTRPTSRRARAKVPKTSRFPTR